MNVTLIASAAECLAKPSAVSAVSIAIAVNTATIAATECHAVTSAAAPLVVYARTNLLHVGAAVA